MAKRTDVLTGPADASVLRRSGRETPSRKQTTSSPVNSGKSARIENHTSPSFSPAKSKLEIIEKRMGPSPLRRSDRGKKLVESTDLPNIKSTKEKPANSSKQSSQDVIEDKKTEMQDPDVGGKKRKKIDAISYKAFFKSQRISESDVGKEPKRQNSMRVQGAPDNGHKAFMERRVIDLDPIEHGDCPKTKSLDGKSIENGDVKEKNGGNVLPSNGKIANSGNMSNMPSHRIEHDLENQQELDTCHKVTKICKAAGSMENAGNNDVSNNTPNSKFVEFWVPVQLSSVQLEQYCATLLSNAMTLRSSLKSDTLGTLKDIFITIQKCCNHPYTVDTNIQQSLMKDKDPSMIVDVGVKASGKLQFLDRILPKIQKHQLKVLILFQHSSGTSSGFFSLGDILVDFVHRRFGQNSYEHVDGVPNISSKKQAAINMFNKDTTKFVFLLELCACHQSIKLSSVDAIIIFDSELNPSNDLKSLQKLSIDSQSEQIMIFRLYSLSTLEERVFKLAENNMVLDIRSQSLRSNYDVLLTWGASDLFKKLTEFHSQTVLDISSEESFLKDVVEEFLYILSHKCKSNDTTSKSIITRVQNCGIYGKNTLCHVDIITHLPNGDQPYIFWRKLLEGRFPVWKFVPESTSRQRKRPNYCLDSPPQRQSGLDGGGVKTCKKAVNISTIEPAKLKTVTKGETGGVNEGVDAANDESQSSSGNWFWSTAVNNEMSLLDFLKPAVSELCNILKFSEDVKITVDRFLEFVLNNYKVSKEDTSTLQAFMISLSWIGSSLAKNKIDRSESFAIAKKHFDFSCEEEQAEAVYKKLKQIKETFLEHTQVRPAIKICVPAPEGVKLRTVTSQHIKNADASKENISRKGVEEFEKINREWDVEKVSLENNNNVKKSVIIALYSVPSTRVMHSGNTKVAPTLPKNPVEGQSHNKPVCEGANDIKSTSKKEMVDATVSSEQIGELPAQQLDDDMEVDSSHENSKGGTSSPDRSHAVEDPAEKLQMLEREFANKLEEQGKLWESRLEKLKGRTLAAMGKVAAENEFSLRGSQHKVTRTLSETSVEARSHDEPNVGDDYNESAVMATTALSEGNAEDSIIRPDEDCNDSCGSDSGNSACAAISQDKTASVDPVSSPVSDHEFQDEEVNVGNLKPSGVSQLEEPILTESEPGENLEQQPPSTVDALNTFDKLTNRVSPEMGNQTDPLEAEVEWLYTVKDNETKFYQETKQRLDAECEKEIEEIVAQISRKYEAKHLEEDIAYNTKKMELETNRNKVIMTRILADAFRRKCHNHTLFGHPG